MMNTEAIALEIDFEGKYYKDYKFQVVDVLDKSYSVDLTVNCRNSERFGAKVNVFYVSGTPSPHELSPNHIFYTGELKSGPQGENSEYDRLWKKYNRNEVKIFNMYINRFMDYLRGMGYTYQHLYNYILDAGIDNRKWNMHAGCSMCKCSPGFKMKGSNIKNNSFSLTFTEIKPKP